jgi:hypothetical protein
LPLGPPATLPLQETAAATRTALCGHNRIAEIA